MTITKTKYHAMKPMILNNRPPTNKFTIDEMIIFRPRDIHNNILIPDDARSFIKYIHEREIAQADNIPRNNLSEKMLTFKLKTIRQKTAVNANWTIKIKKNRRANIIERFTLFLCTGPNSHLPLNMFKNPNNHETKMAIKVTKAENPIIRLIMPNPKIEPTTNIIKKSKNPKSTIPLSMCFIPSSVLDLK
jgi:hypothetical protein